MKLNRKSLQLYVVTDQSFLKGKNFLQEIELILQGGATFLQLREKNTSFEDYVALAKEVKKITDAYDIPFVINDAVDVAILMDADGVHVGQSDLNASKVREKIGPHKILGVSAQTVEQAVLAQQQGADYIGVGALFTTNTKHDADSVSLETLKAIVESVSIPVVGIGGINEDNIKQLQGYKLDGVAIVSAIFAKPDVKSATKELSYLTQQIIR